MTSTFRALRAARAWVLVPIAVGACAQVPAPVAGAPAVAAPAAAEPDVEHGVEAAQRTPRRAEPLPARELTGQILYQLLLAEISGRRGNLPLAVTAYLDLAEKTRDPRIARRAAEMAHFAQRPEIALQAARLWLDIDPQSLPARHVMVGLLAAQNRYDELSEHAAVLLAQDEAAVPRTLLQLNRLFERLADRAAARSLVDRLTVPYLERPEAHLARAQAAYAADDMAGAYSEAGEALRRSSQAR